MGYFYDADAAVWRFDGKADNKPVMQQSHTNEYDSVFAAVQRAEKQFNRPQETNYFDDVFK